jgi:hypothetical protein
MSTPPKPSEICLLLSTEADDHYVIYGQIVQEGSGDIFLGNSGARIPMEPEWLSGARPITEKTRGVFGEGPSHFIQLLVGDIPDGDDLKSYVPTGLKVPPNANP